MQQTSNIPVDISRFFETLYGNAPTVSQDKKNTVYAISEKGVSIITDPYGGCHIEIGNGVDLECAV